MKIAEITEGYIDTQEGWASSKAQLAEVLEL